MYSYKCEYCNKIYFGKGSKYNLNRHIIHCDMNPLSVAYKCVKCNREFGNRYSLSGHSKNCGEEKVKYIRKKNPIKTNCIFCGFEELNPQKLGFHISRCKLNINFIENDKKFRKGGVDRDVSEETRKRISESRIKYLHENPDKVPYLLNHSSKESYPEKYFRELFVIENIEVEYSFRIGLYELDFCIPDLKIDIEIDGCQHYLDKKIVESDKRRTKFLEENGWCVIRIRWSEYKKLSFVEKLEFISNLKDRIKTEGEADALERRLVSKTK